jgi:hypothetical protein
VGLAVCVGLGGAVGVMLGQSDGDSDADAQRVAALALDARGLNEDALGLSRAIEEAIAREELEGEAESLRTELASLEARAEEIRVRAQSGAGAGPPQARNVSRSVERGLGRISNTVAVFERDVVDRLEPVLDEPSSAAAPVGEPPEASDPSVEEALAAVTQVLEDQGEAMNALAENLEEADEEADRPATEGAADEEGELVSESFDGELVPSEGALEIGYELEDLEPEIDVAGDDESGADVAGADPGEATITSAAAGELTLKNTGSARERLELPTFHLVLYWKESDVPRAARDAELRVGSSAEGDLEEEGAIEEGKRIDEGEADVEGGAGTEGSAPCRYEIEGDAHCALARFAFDREVDHERNAAGELVLRPDDEVAIDTPEPEESLTVRKGKADAVADFIESHPPDLVEVLAMGAEAERFQPACVVSSELEETTSPELIVEPYPMATLGILTGDGDVVFEADETSEPMIPDSEGEPEALECYTLLAE